jgi:transcriptional regulator with XRE-family HTH domain
MNRFEKPKTRLGKLVRTKRLAMQMSQRELAEKLGTTKQAISLIEISRRSSTQSCKLLPRIAPVIGISVRELTELSTPRKMHRPRGGSRLGEFITSRRVRLGLTQKDVATLAGLGQGTYSNIEYGRRSLELEEPEAIEKALNCAIPEGVRPSRFSQFISSVRHRHCRRPKLDPVL